MKLILFFATLTLWASSSVAVQRVRIITVEEAPANYLNSSGQADGYVTDIINAMQLNIQSQSNLLTENQHAVAIEFVPEARSLSILQSDKNVVMFSISKTKSRQNQYLWIGKVMKKAWQVYSLPDTQIEISDINSLRQLDAIGVVRGDIREEWLIEKGFSNLQSVTHHAQNLQMLLRGRVPVIIHEPLGILSNLQAIDQGIEIVKPTYLLNTSSVYIVMSASSDPEIFNQWRNAYLSIKQDGTLKEISLKWQSKIYAELSVLPEIKDDVLVF
ncbi:transporter substrate-binding domain-containing protein [Psychrosphaera sp. 1_MG-2023]|nr:transporter substrate-binding domain-containing protein [Psychrosphaera sp. 1_MG-2023]MDO6719260.1 transporter substrate-binding domain-containing protein [Psychrosphaera sp. 1_MG-2023]